MSEKKIDRRVIKTKRAIRNAFITLMAQKDVNDISIKDIADAADVDRKTVYNYYNGIFEKNISNPQQIFATLTEILNGNLDLYSSLMKLESKSMIIRKLARALTEVVREGLTNNPAIQGNIKKIDIAAQFITGGMLSTYQYWFNSDRSLPLEDLSREIGNVVLYGIKCLEK